jgi:chromosome segregation ATPase
MITQNDIAQQAVQILQEVKEDILVKILEAKDKSSVIQQFHEVKLPGAFTLTKEKPRKASRSKRSSPPPERQPRPRSSSLADENPSSPKQHRVELNKAQAKLAKVEKTLSTVKAQMEKLKTTHKSSLDKKSKALKAEHEKHKETKQKLASTKAQLKKITKEHEMCGYDLCFRLSNYFCLF